MTIKPSYEELERRVQELEKIDSELEYFKEMLRVYEKASLGYQSLDENGHYITVNQNWLDTLGYAKEEVIGKSFADFIHPDWRHHFKENFPRFKSIGEILGAEFEMVKKNGDLIKVSLTGKISRDKKGDFQHTHCIFHDITERTRAEEALKEKTQLLQNITDNMFDLVSLTDMKGNFTFLGPSHKILNYDLDSLIGKNVLEFVHPEDLPEISSVFNDFLFSRDDNQKVEYRYRCADGTYIWLETVGRFIKDARGNPKEILFSSRDITGRKRTEKELIKEATRQRILMENSRDGIVILDQTGKLIESNRRFADMLGYPPESMYELNVFDWEFHHPPDRLIEMINSVDEKGDSFETRHRRRDGSIYEVEISSNATWFDGQKLIFCICRDITNRKQAEQALAESETRYKALHNASFGGITIHDQGIILECNQGLIEMTGYQYSELIGMDGLLLISERSREAVMNNIRSGYEKPYEAFGLRKNGEEFPIRLEARNVPYKGKQVRTVEFRDITERKKAEKELIGLKRRNQALLDYSPVCHKIVDLDFNLQYMSASGFRMLKFDDNAQIYGKPYPFAFFSSTFQNEMIQNLKKVKKTGNPITIEALAKDIEGNGIWLESALIPVFDDNGKIEYLTVVSADTTRRKEDEKEKERLERQLQQTQKMESIGSLAGGIAHDFNNLLFPIVGLSEMMLDDFPSDSPEHHNLYEIFKAGKRGRELIQQILSFSRQSEYQRIPVHIQKILKEVLKLCRATIPADITITRDIQTDCAPVMADPTQIHQIAMNLITNAYHAVESTGGTITVQLKGTDFIYAHDPALHVISGRYAVLSVSDTGTGIDPVVMNKIFDPYFTTKKKGKGTGLGLATVYGIVKAHGGDIKVHSEVGKGSCFHVCLPVLEKSADVVPEKQQQPLPTGTEHILLVDDEAPIVHMEQQMLERLGYRITCFSSSVDALAAFRTDPSCFDMIITDMNMPNLNGMLLAEQLTAIRSDIPVIICTGFSERINKENAAAKGVKGLLMKPLVMKDLAQKVREVLDTMKE